MTAFHKEYTTGAWVALGGIALTAIHLITVAQDDGGTQPALGYAGAAMLLTGGVIMIDSHKHMNLNRVQKKL